MKLFLRRLLAVLLVYPFIAIAVLTFLPMIAIETVGRFVYCRRDPGVFSWICADMWSGAWPEPCVHEEKNPWSAHQDAIDTAARAKKEKS